MSEQKKADLIGRLTDPDYRGAFQHLRDWRELDALHDEVVAELTGLRSLNAALVAERDVLRAHVANINNKVRHELSAEIEAASDKAFSAMSAVFAMREARATGGQ